MIIGGGVAAGGGNALEQGDGLGETFGEKGQCRGQAGWLGGPRGGYGEAEEVDGLGEVGVDAVEGGDVDWLGDGDGVGGHGAKLEMESLREDG